MATAPIPPEQELDTADTANKPQAGDPDNETFETMLAGLREHLFGKGEQGVVQRMTESQDPAKTLGEIVFVMVKEAADQAGQAGRDIDMDILMGVATELIDDISELMEAAGTPIDEKARGDALLYAQQFYVESADLSEDDINAAKQSLASMHEGGEVDEAVSYIQQRGTEEGVDPFGVEEQTPPARPAMMGRK